MRILGIVALGAALGGCAFQRAEIAQDARAQMIGMPKEQVLACMGAPGNKAAEGKTEVWGYNSGNGMTVTDASYSRFGGTMSIAAWPARSWRTTSPLMKMVRKCGFT